MSTDRTLEIATAHGAKVTRRPFDNWASHQNWGLQNVPFKHPWVFYIDADERMTPALTAAVQAAVRVPGDAVAFQVERRDFLMGRWLAHVQNSRYYMRLFQPAKMRYERLVNPVSIADGPVGKVGGYLDHFPFSKGMSHWIERHNQYSTLEARQAAANSARGAGLGLGKALFGKNFQEKRYHQKKIFYRLPLRPVIKFFVLYIGKRGFLDGRAGLSYAMLQSVYEYFIVLKTREIEAAQAAQTGAAEPSGSVND